MNNQMRIVVAALAVVAAGYAGSVAAQDSDSMQATYVSNTGAVLHCDAPQGQVASCGDVHKPMFHKAIADASPCVPASGNGRSYCGQSPAPFVADDSRNPVCVEGKTWGMDQGNLWVSGRCGAYYPTGANPAVAGN
jgi:hypothetical protein